MTRDQFAPDQWWESPPRPALLIAAGFMLGPQSLDVLHASTLVLVDPIIPVALASAGLVAVLLRRRRAIPELVLLGLLAVMLLVFRDDPSDVTTVAGRGWRAVQACGAASLVGVAGVLLLKGAAATARRIFVLALLLLLGGISDFTSTPALLTTVVAGMICVRFGGPGMEAIHRDLEYLARPLVTALLVLTGARLDFSDTTLMLAGICIVVALVVRRAGYAPGSPSGVYLLAGAVDAARGLHPALAPLAGGATIAIVVLHAAVFITAADRTPIPAAEGAAP